MKNRFVPSNVMIPHIACSDVAESLRWLAQTFGFAEHFRYGDPVAGAQVFLGNAVMMLMEERPGRATPSHLGASTQFLTIVLDDVTAHYQHTKTTAARIVEDLNETIYGELQYGVEDLNGHLWIFSQHLRDLSPDDWGATIHSSPGE